MQTTNNRGKYILRCPKCGFEEIIPWIHPIDGSFVHLARCDSRRLCSHCGHYGMKSRKIDDGLWVLYCLNPNCNFVERISWNGSTPPS
jgi:rRNA maturation protein Nop10